MLQWSAFEAAPHKFIGTASGRAFWPKLNQLFAFLLPRPLARLRLTPFLFLWRSERTQSNERWEREAKCGKKY